MSNYIVTTNDTYSLLPNSVILRLDFIFVRNSKNPKLYTVMKNRWNSIHLSNVEWDKCQELLDLYDESKSK